jgi:CHAD domain-containing protein
VASVTLSSSDSPAREQYGLAYWMGRTLEECDHAASDFAKDPVHDLRVALRRCRSMADGLMALDPCKDWKRMKKAGRQLFRALGELRDAQVMNDWIDDLSPVADSVSKILAADATAREHASKQAAQLELSRFDRKRWSRWSESLPKRAERIPLGGPIFLHMALERWTEARELQSRVLRHPSNAGWHSLRIGIKKFRYTVENFLPQLHEQWVDDLKDLQDYLGEVHDLDVLWETALRIGAFPDPELHQKWQLKIREERERRIQKYREKMVGPNSLWKVWRKQLPHGQEIEDAAYERFRLWGAFLDPDPRHSQRVCRHALQLYDGLLSHGLVRSDREYDLRSVLRLAATLHEVGRSKGATKHHKRGSRLIRQISAPLGYAARDLQLASIVARYHRGALPSTAQKSFAHLSAAQQKRTLLLSGILRLADSLEASRNGSVRRLSVSRTDSHLLVTVAGYDPGSPAGAQVAVARHILETLYGLPLIVRPTETPASGRNDDSRGTARLRSGALNRKSAGRVH